MATSVFISCGSRHMAHSTDRFVHYGIDDIIDDADRLGVDADCVRLYQQVLGRRRVTVKRKRGNVPTFTLPRWEAYLRLEAKGEALIVED